MRKPKPYKRINGVVTRVEPVKPDSFRPTHYSEDEYKISDEASVTQEFLDGLMDGSYFEGVENE